MRGIANVGRGLKKTETSHQREGHHSHIQIHPVHPGSNQL